MLRAHQVTTDAIIRRTCSGAISCTDVLAHVTPGGGKSALPLIAGRLIQEGLADKICWIVPRLTLQYQAESNFIDPFFRRLLRHNLTIRSATNDVNPSRGLAGFATTYQAIGVNNSHAVRDFEKHRYILVCDEFHHMESGSLWHKAVEPLAELSKYRLWMTGTLTRGDKKEIGFFDYRTIAEGPTVETRAIVLDETDTFRHIRYSRADALAERAIIPVKFFLHDGATRWQTRDGAEFAYDTFGMSKGQASAAVYTAIHTEFAEELMDAGVQHWLQYRRRHRSSQILVVTANIELARKALAHLRRRNIPAELATSADSDEARESIRKLNTNRVPCLVGVSMFYEGFDRKQISHIVALTHIRSTPWIEQMVARAVRVDPAIPYDDQYAYVFAPNDPNFRRIVSIIESEQMEFVQRRKPRDCGQISMFGDQDGTDKEHPIIPLGSSLNNFHEKTVGQHHAGAPLSVVMEPTPSERERALRKSIEDHVRAYALNAGYKPIRINRELKDAFCGKGRDEMNLFELESVKQYLLIHYPLDRRRRPPVRRSATML